MKKRFASGLGFQPGTNMSRSAATTPPPPLVPILFIYHTIRLPSKKVDYTISLVWHIQSLCEFTNKHKTNTLNSLTAIGGHDRQLIYELRARVVSLRICVRYQRLMARKIAELFGLNRGVRPFYAARCFDELSRGSFSCLLNASFKTAVSQRHNSIF